MPKVPGSRTHAQWACGRPHTDGVSALGQDGAAKGRVWAGKQCGLRASPGPLRLSPTSTTDPGPACLQWGRPGLRAVLPDPHPLSARSTQDHDSPRCPQTSPCVPRGQIAPRGAPQFRGSPPTSLRQCRAGHGEPEVSGSRARGRNRRSHKLMGVEEDRDRRATALSGCCHRRHLGGLQSAQAG